MNIKELKSKKLYKEYSIEIPYDEIDIEVDNKINQILPTVNIPGFRKGFVPMGLVKKQYGNAVKVDEINKLLDTNLKKYIQEEKLDILGGPIPKVDNKILFLSICLLN